MNISTFDQEVLHVMRYASPDGMGTFAQTIANEGQQEFDVEWPGPNKPRKKLPQVPVHPKIDFALGRLAKAGLVERLDDPIILQSPHSMGLWRLTDMGYTLVGDAS